MQTEHVGKETLWVEIKICDKRNNKYFYIRKMYVCLDSPKSIKMFSFEISIRNIELNVKFYWLPWEMELSNYLV